MNLSLQPIYRIKKTKVDVQSSSNVLLIICPVIQSLPLLSGDKAFQEYSVLISTGNEIGKCSKVDKKNERMDHFYFKNFDMDDTNRNLGIVLQLIFVLSHGQASVERGFSLNKGVLNDNMTELSIIPRQVVKD